MFSTHRGTARTHGMLLSDVLLIPNFPKRLISIGRIDDDGGSMTIGGNQNKLEYQGVAVPLTKIGRIYRPWRRISLYEISGMAQEGRNYPETNRGLP